MNADDHENDGPKYTQADFEAARQQILREENAPKLVWEPKPKPLTKEQLNEKARARAPTFAAQREAEEKAAKEREAGKSATDKENDKHRRFAEWEEKKREDLRLKQEAAQRTLRQAQAPRREILETQLKDHAQARQRHLDKLAVLNERQERGSFFSRGIDKLKGVDSEREAIYKSLEDTERRMNEASAGLNRQDEEWTKLHRQQFLASERLEQLIVDAREAGYQIPPEPNRSISHDRGDRGPER